MSESFLGEIRMFSFNWAPRNWLLCNGATLQIRQYNALAALLGTRYGGDGVNTFQIPDLQGRTPLHYGVHSGIKYNVGNKVGTETVALSMSTLPVHSHEVCAVTLPADGTSPADNCIATAAPNAKTGDISPPYAAAPATPSSDVPLNPGTVSIAGGSQPHSNVQPYSVTNFCICTAGYWPSRP